MTLKDNPPYSMSFSTGALYRHSSIMIAKLYADLNDWPAVRSKVINDNLLQARTRNTAARVCSEIISRLKNLTPNQLSILIDGQSADQGYILWAAVCKRYRFINDFAVEVLHAKFVNMELLLTHLDYDEFFNQKAEWHEEIARVRASTRQKLRQVVFKMLRESELLSRQHMIIQAILSPVVEASIKDDPDLTLAIFPIEDRKAKK